jgi:hypothetical protein
MQRRNEVGTHFKHENRQCQAGREQRHVFEMCGVERLALRNGIAVCTIPNQPRGIPLTRGGLRNRCCMGRYGNHCDFLARQIDRSRHHTGHRYKRALHPPHAGGARHILYREAKCLQLRWISGSIECCHDRSDGRLIIRGDCGRLCRKVHRRELYARHGEQCLFNPPDTGTAIHVLDTEGCG